jgi:hypothetical protein
MFLDCLGKHVFRPIDLHPYLGQIGKLEGRAVLIYQCFNVESIEDEITIFDFQTFLGEIKCLLDKVGVCVIAQFLFWY